MSLTYNPYRRECPSRALLDRIGDKWSILVLGELADEEPHRFAAIRRRLEGVSEKMLTQTLRNMEHDGLIVRSVFAEVPPRVEYRLTPLGITLRGPLRALTAWSIEHMPAVIAARHEYEAAGRPPRGSVHPTDNAAAERSGRTGYAST